MSAAPDFVVFAEAVYQANYARCCRKYARMIRRGTTVYGWTLAKAEGDARRAESVVRRLADQTMRDAAATGEQS